MNYALVASKRLNFSPKAFPNRQRSSLLPRQSVCAVACLTSPLTGTYKPDLNHTYTEADPYVDHDFMTRLVHDVEAACACPGSKQVQSVQVRIGKSRF